MIGGSIVGFIFRYMSERAKERHEIYKRAIGLKQAEIDSANAAAKRVSVDAGKWIRRCIVVCVLFGVILAPFILALLGLNTIVEINEVGSTYFFGMFEEDDAIKFLELEGYLLVPEVRQTLTALVGFYFGNAAAAGKT